MLAAVDRREDAAHRYRAFYGYHLCSSWALGRNWIPGVWWGLCSFSKNPSLCSPCTPLSAHLGSRCSRHSQRQVQLPQTAWGISDGAEGHTPGAPEGLRKSRDLGRRGSRKLGALTDMGHSSQKATEDINAPTPGMPLPQDLCMFSPQPRAAAHRERGRS